MRIAEVFVNGQLAGQLKEVVFEKKYSFEYFSKYRGDAVSITMPVKQIRYEFDFFPPFFDGLLPEGYQLDGLLKIRKIDRNDFFSQLMAVGNDLVGNVTVKEVDE
jgi:serine/threonine-protein kinase HipA